MSRVPTKREVPAVAPLKKPEGLELIQNGRHGLRQRLQKALPFALGAAALALALSAIKLRKRN
jgi:hypothetical protein